MKNATRKKSIETVDICAGISAIFLHGGQSELCRWNDKSARQRQRQTSGAQIQIRFEGKTMKARFPVPEECAFPAFPMGKFRDSRPRDAMYKRRAGSKRSTSNIGRERSHDLIKINKTSQNNHRLIDSILQIKSKVVQNKNEFEMLFLNRRQLYPVFDH